MATLAMPTPDVESKQPQQQQEADAADPSVDNPLEQTAEESAAAVELSPEEQEALLKVRKDHKEEYAPKRRVFIRRALRAVEMFKGNPYVLDSETAGGFDSLSEILQGVSPQGEVDLYQYQDNVYQMLGLAFIATLVVDVSKTRYQPADAMNEEDILTAKKASTIHAFNERRNGIEGLQQLELLYLWMTGQFFTYTRHIIDRNRAGVTKEPITAIQNQIVLPSRYVCSGCGGVTPEDQVSAFQKPACPGCKQPLQDADWHQEQALPLPVKVGENDIPNGMTAFDVYSGLNVDADPEAKELYESMILDLEIETSVAVVRAAYPKMYAKLKANESGDGSSDDEMAKRARSLITSPGSGVSLTGASRGTYSRCWIQPEAFNVLDDENMANGLKAKFPNGVKLVTYASDIFLQATPERMMSKWSWCPTLKGFGLYSMGAGDAALDLQPRINNTANTVQAMMDRAAFGTMLYDADIIDGDALAKKSLSPGNMTPVNRTDEDTGQSKPLRDLMFQPDFKLEPHIFEYEAKLIQLAQVLCGVQPQTFGGSDPNVQTMGGQAQALKTAVGRMMLYLKRIREEHAARAANSVNCSIDNMDDEMRVVVDGEVDGDYSTEVLLRNEMTGEFHTYPESDEGFPATYQEIQDRIIQLMTQASDAPFLAELLADPDTQHSVASYLLPNDQIKLPGDEDRSHIKMLLQKLSKSAPNLAPGPNGPMAVPSILPNPDYMDMGVAVILAKKWLNQNWQMQEQNPDGFNNVLALLRVAKTMAATEAAKQQLIQAQAAGGAPPPGQGGPPQGAPPPQ